MLSGYYHHHLHDVNRCTINKYLSMNFTKEGTLLCPFGKVCQPTLSIKLDGLLLVRKPVLFSVLTPIFVIYGIGSSFSLVKSSIRSGYPGSNDFAPSGNAIYLVCSISVTCRILLMFLLFAGKGNYYSNIIVM